MKLFICPICQKPQECDDRVGDSCKVYHRDCLDKELEPTRNALKAEDEARKHLYSLTLEERAATMSK